MADLRELFAANPGKKQELRARLEARIPPEFAAVTFPQNGAGGGAGNRDVGALSRGLIKGYNDVIKVKDFDEVLSELKLLPTSDHLRTWHALAGPSVRDDIFHYLQMFELLEAIVDDAPLQRPRSLASIKGALMDMEAVGLLFTTWDCCVAYIHILTVFHALCRRFQSRRCHFGATSGVSNGCTW